MMMKSLAKTCYRSLRQRPLASVYQKYREYTMVSRKSYIHNLELARQVAGVPGLVVECGVWRGGMSAGIADVLGRERTYVLCDSFEGLPQAKEIDGERAMKWQADVESPVYFDNCAAPLDVAKEAMGLSCAEKTHFLKGWFCDTLPTFPLEEPIALLRLDGDWYDSTMQCLEPLFPRMAPGGIVIIDDYHTWDGCSRAVHDYLSRVESTIRVRQWNDDVCYLRV